jgi:voltage-gated potassium channel
MLGVVADASRDETLRDVGVDKARGLIATLSSDADNLFLILTAKTLNPNLQLTARIAEESSEQKMRRAGADYVFAPYNSTGHRMVQALLKPHVMQFLDFTTQANMGINVGIEQVQIEQSCAYQGRPLSDMQIARDTGVIVLAVRRASGEMTFNPPPDSKLSAGDHLIAMGQPEGLRKLERLLDGDGR